MCSARHRLGILLGLGLASSASSQWAALPHAPSQPVHAGAGLLVHENTSGIYAFSALSQAWIDLAGPAGSIVGTGAWLALVREGNELRAWSARTNRISMAALPPANVLATSIADEALFVLASVGAQKQAWAYSAQTSTWSVQGLVFGAQPGDWSATGSTIGLRDGLRYLGYSALSGQWSISPFTGLGMPPQVSEHVALANLDSVLSGSGPHQYATFSALRGIWVLSPVFVPGSPSLLTRNLACLQVPGAGGLVRLAGYSAARGEWVVSTHDHNPGALSLLGNDNVLRARDVEASPQFELFGALPGTAWVEGPVPNLDDLGAAPGPDATALHDSAAQKLYAFDGLRGQAWVATDTHNQPQVIGAPAHALVLLDGAELLAFSPRLQAWAAPQALAGPPQVDAADGVVVLRDLQFHAWTPRWNQWQAGDALQANASYQAAAVGSLAVYLQQGGVSDGLVRVFDERAGQWAAPLYFGAQESLSGGGHAAIVFPQGSSGGLSGYSVARGNWSAPQGVVLPLVVAPSCSDYVGWTVDAAGMLWAFAAGNPVQVWYDWPGGREWSFSGADPLGGQPGTLALSLHGKPGVDLALLYWGLEMLNPGLALAGIEGLLCLEPSTAYYFGNLGLVDADGLREASVPLSTSLPAGLQVWLQALLIDTGSFALRLGERCEPAAIF